MELVEDSLVTDLLMFLVDETNCKNTVSNEVRYFLKKKLLKGDFC